MKFLLALGFPALLLCADNSIRGFPADAGATEKKWEDKMRAIPEPARVGRYIQRMSNEPHMAGTPQSKAVADYLVGLLREWGLDARLEEFEALLPTPVSRRLEMVSPKTFRAKLQEPAVPGDKNSADPGQVPTFNAYSGSGDVTAPLVYVNYGVPADYEVLKKLGIDVKGKIVIARYGGSWRGTKPKVAQEHGALGCLIYSDPRDDGYYQGDVYPKGAYRPPDGVQRGSVVDMALYPGDPLSPGFASEKGVKRLAVSEAKTLMKIPVMPISYADATPLLENLDGPVAPEDWRGALGFTYHIGPGSTKVHFKVEMDNSTHPLYDVLVRIPGSEFPDEWILYGNHHDAWVHGASDPGSGAASLLETARSLSELVKQGWKPKRTVMLALWDGEEFGLMGSTEWAEKHADELNKKLVTYINSDSNGKGRLGVGGSHTLEEFVSQLARDIPDPVTGKALIDAPRTPTAARRRVAQAPAVPPDDGRYHIGALGSGSVYTSFLQHLGVATLNMGFGGEGGGVYHSDYDDFYWYSHFSDTTFAYGKTLSEVTGTAMMRLADAPLLPFEFGRFVSTVTGYTDEIERLEKQKGHPNLGDLRTALDSLRKSAVAFDTAYTHALPKTSSAAANKLSAINTLLFHSERTMMLAGGLPGRDWFKHAIYAPGTYTGYGVKTLPGVREAVEGDRADEASQQAEEIVKVLRSLNSQIQEAQRLLEAL
ncbi:MAG: Glutamate carboxypeptidase [Bryobacterales bacterium]|nr:Glutamate carboxypeptidase [Bryobacterales bacterium]